ncbi:hypothetical protein [Moorena sp. SIO2C4]|uniref:hypothetical protein n=1 Tax=Moorena sp. SIO2C4 TaxID=2607824 RepID=UPI0013C0F00B|nr:hypothetical protein [Moorena sp. SIO2C4]NEQ17195.1 hypothetical protein [Moorena sp. SIO3E2]NES46081.1 hypothetical protein [Moorena sp. SIO2C4]
MGLLYIAEVRSQKSEVRSQTLALLDAVAHGGNPQDRNGALSVGERIKFATGRTSASLTKGVRLMSMS